MEAEVQYSSGEMKNSKNNKYVGKHTIYFFLFFKMIIDPKNTIVYFKQNKQYILGFTTYIITI